MKIKLSRKAPAESDRHFSGCAICGAPLIYDSGAVDRTCAVCRKTRVSNAVCESGHFVCDDCHGTAAASVMAFLLKSSERDAGALLAETLRLAGVHMHGPEHHFIVPCVLLTAYKNCGGKLDLERALTLAVSRGKQVPGGACGYLGVCGAAAGAGIFAGIVLGSTPKSAAVWSLPQELTALCLTEIASHSGPRCCKRTSRAAVEIGTRFTRERLGIDMQSSGGSCEYPHRNRDCLRAACPYFDKEI